MALALWMRPSRHLLTALQTAAWLSSPSLQVEAAGQLLKTTRASKSGSRLDTTNEDKLGEGRVASIHHSGIHAQSLFVCITIHVAMDALVALIAMTASVTIANYHHISPIKTPCPIPLNIPSSHLTSHSGQASSSSFLWAAAIHSFLNDIRFIPTFFIGNRHHHAVYLWRRRAGHGPPGPEPRRGCSICRPRR